MGWGEKHNPNSTWYKKRHGGTMLPGIRYLNEAEKKQGFWSRIWNKILDKLDQWFYMD